MQMATFPHLHLYVLVLYFRRSYHFLISQFTFFITLSFFWSGLEVVVEQLEQMDLQRLDMLSNQLFLLLFDVKIQSFNLLE